MALQNFFQYTLKYEEQAIFRILGYIEIECFSHCYCLTSCQYLLSFYFLRRVEEVPVESSYYCRM